MKKYNQYILSILFITCVFVNLIYIVNSIHFQNKTIKNEYEIMDENIVFFGDSITYQYNLEEYFKGHNVVNKGRNGNKTEDLVRRLDDLYLYNPSKIFILIGINDLTEKLEIEDIINDYSIIIKSIKENRKYAKIYVESVYPINMDVIKSIKKERHYHLNNETISELNSKIKELCYQENVTYINVYDKLLDDEGKLKEKYTTDGLHISHLGYLRISAILNKYIKGD